ncbi:MAG: hypothetical protein EBE86_006740 [Hormoscilla sp. GUM202]|nr:hypothetical protein [Hormoscilla sp. GUM202]
MAYILALAIGMGSLALYTAAFFFPEVYRKGDFFWSGVGMFYALILWFCAGRITGAVLLGQLAVVAIVLWFGWQILMLRRSLTPVAEQTQIKGDLKEQLKGGLSGLPQLVKTGFKKGEQSSVAPPTTPDATGEQEIETDEAIAPPQTDDAEQSEVTEAIAPPQTDDAEQSGVTEAIAPPQTDDAEQSGVTEAIAPPQTDDAEAIAPPQTDGSRDADASAEAVREKEEEPVKPGKQKPRGFLGLGKILGSVTSRSKKPDQKITSSDSPDDESEWDSPAETSAPTAGVPDATASETIAPSDVETREAATELEQATVPEPEEPVTEPEQATSPEPEETQAEETASQETTSESGSQSAEIKAKTDDVP